MEKNDTTGFPEQVPVSLRQAYAQRGIKQLFDWQADCLANESLFSPNFENLVYSAPTSAGKTLIAEVVAACNIISTNRRALFIFPYISNAREKLFYLKSLWRPINLVVKAFIGASSANIHGWSAAVCTIEKASALLNALIESDLMSDIGTIVVDELHMLYDSERGVVVENLLIKMLYLAKTRGVQIQLIGMSATLDEHKKLGEWLNAHVFISNFRPLQLSEFVLTDSVVLDLDGASKIRELPEHITIEAILESKAVLIFCSTKDDMTVNKYDGKIKAEAEQNAILLAKYMKYCMDKGDSNRFSELNKLFPVERQKQIVDYFRQKTICTERDLLNCIAQGVAYHHAGLTVEEREEIEFLFRRGSVKVLVSTSTLSSGVNLPAHRVIIRTNATSPIPLTFVTYNQMVGRAGRQGQDNVVSGESYLLCPRADWPIIQRQIQRRHFVRPVRPLTRTLLETINSGLVSTLDELDQLVGCAFSKSPSSVEDELRELNGLKLVDLSEDASQQVDDLEAHDVPAQLAPTQLGRAVLASSLEPRIAVQIFAGLESAMRSVCLDSELHLLFLVTPVNNLAVNANAIDWNFFHQKWVELPESLARVALRVGITEEFFMQKLGGKSYPRDHGTLKVHIRFFASLILFELINEIPLEKVARHFKINRGLLQSLQQQAATYAYMIVSFCDRLGWFHLRVLLEGFAERLQFGVRRDLTELIRVPGIDAVRARSFHQNGIASLVSLANCPPEKICNILRKAVPFVKHPNADHRKNTWLFGEPPLEDHRAARELIRRAKEVIKEQLEPFSLKNANANDLSLRFDSSTLSVVAEEEPEGNAKVDESAWLSEEDSSSYGLDELCETLSPLRLAETLDAAADSEKVAASAVDLTPPSTVSRVPFLNKKKGCWTAAASRVPLSPLQSTASPLCKKRPPAFEILSRKLVEFWEHKSGEPHQLITENGVKLSSVDLETTMECKEEASMARQSRKCWKRLNVESNAVVAEMARVGFRIDRGKADRMIDKVLVEMAREEQRIFAISREPFNLDSPTEVAKILFVKMRLNAPESASSGGSSGNHRHLSTASAVLKQMPHPICESILHWRRLDHALSSLRSLMSAVSGQEDSRIRAQFDCAGTISGRIISTEPNLQFVPKRPILGKYSVRSVFTASPGRLLLAADYSQLELRVLCELSADKALVQLLNAIDKLDPFERIAKAFTANNAKLAVSREKAKQLCYAIIYGMGAESLAREMCLPDNADAQELINRFFHLFPRVKCWIEDKVEDYRQSGVCETYLGRRTSFGCEDTDSGRGTARMGRRCVNYIIQGTASEMFRQALINISERLRSEEFSAEIVMELHDEVLLELDESRLGDCALVLKQCMEGVFPEFSTYFPVKLSAGSDWGSLQPLANFQ